MFEYQGCYADEDNGNSPLCLDNLIESPYDKCNLMAPKIRVLRKAGGNASLWKSLLPISVAHFPVKVVSPIHHIFDSRH